MAKRKSAKRLPQVFKFAANCPFNVYGSGIAIKDPALCWKIMQRAANQRAEQLGESPPDSYSRVEFICKQSGLHSVIIKNGRNYVLEMGYKTSIKKSKFRSKSRGYRKEAGKELNDEAVAMFLEIRGGYTSDRAAARYVCGEGLELEISPDTLVRRVKKAQL